jgi:hypothetical protein
MAGKEHRWAIEAIRLGRRLALHQTLKQPQSRQMNKATATKFFQAIHGMPHWAASIAADEYERVWQQRSTLPLPNPKRTKMKRRRFVNPVSAWPNYEYKIVRVNRATTITSPGRAPLHVSAGDFVIFESEQLEANNAPNIRPVEVVGPTPGRVTGIFDNPEEMAKDIARERSKKLDPRNPNPVRVLDAAGRCIYSFMHGESVSCTAAAENPRASMSVIGGITYVEGVPVFVSRTADGWCADYELSHRSGPGVAHRRLRACRRTQGDLLSAVRSDIHDVRGLAENPVSTATGVFIIGASVATGLLIYWLMQPPQSPEVTI